MRIDYTKPGKDILWQCLEAAAIHILKVHKGKMPDMDWDDMLMDVMVAGHDRVMQSLNEWNHEYPFHNFVYWHVWSASGNALQIYYNRVHWRSEHIANIDSPISDTGEISISDVIKSNAKIMYMQKKDYRDAYRKRKKISAGKNPVRSSSGSRAMHEEYLDYLDYCGEFGIEPISEKDYHSRCDELGRPCNCPEAAQGAKCG